MAAGLFEKGGNSLDHVVRRMSVEEAFARTRYSDYGVLSVFTVAVPEAYGDDPTHVFATGLFGTFVVMSNEPR